MSTPPFDLGLLLDMLTYRRPAGSQTESAFIDRFIAPLPNAGRDAFGNWHIWIGQSPIVWSTHTDTVHRSDGRQTVSYDPKTGRIGVSRRSKRGRRPEDRSSCLGADDTAGVFLAVSMIRANVAGHYIFHYGEEIGGYGSSDLAMNAPDLLADARFAIAFDRKGYGDIITHQAFDRCCSDLFAHSLADQLNTTGNGLTFRPCDSGLFTDTANYTNIIGECTNLSVGYFDAHSRSETLNAHFLARLLPALCAIDPDRLADMRKSGEIDRDTRVSGFRWRPWQSAGETASLIPLEHCEYCGETFDPVESTANTYMQYCSLECEETDYREIADRMGSTYLDPVYEDVTRALLDGMIKPEDQ